MKISVIAVGRAGSGPEAKKISEYVKRLPWSVDIVEVEEKRPLPAPERMKSEGEKLLAAVPKGAFTVALDKGGKTYDSPGFSAALEKWFGAGGSHIAFLIGGADGLSKEVLETANTKLSFGAMTWPHMLARVMLMEQIYRAWAIRERHPYHK